MYYLCDICNYHTGRKSSYEKHLLTKKHLEKVDDVPKNTLKKTPSPRATKSIAKVLQKPLHKCAICKRSFSSKGNLNQHLFRVHKIDNRKFSYRSKKVLQKLGTPVEPQPPKTSDFPPKTSDTQNCKSITCGYCKKEFTRIDNLTRHINTRCRTRRDKLAEYDRIKGEYDEMKDKMDEKDSIIKDATKANKFAMSAFKMLTERFVNAPTLNTIGNNGLETIVYRNITNDADLIRALIYYYNNKTLIKYIGDSIVALYKKEDPADQSFWNSDTQRLSYIIRTVVCENPEWVRDRGGKLITKMIITPLICYIDEKLKNFLVNTFPTKSEVPVEFNEKMVTVHKIRCIMQDKKAIEEQILNYKSPFFHFTANNMIELK